MQYVSTVREMVSRGKYRHPELSTRIEKAALIALFREIEFQADGSYLVESDTTPGTRYRAFHGYSLGNQLLALVQCHERGLPPGPIATFQRWKELGRHVRRAEKALVLCRPMPYTRRRTGHRFEHFWALLANTGLRVREAAGLRWQDVFQDQEGAQPPAEGALLPMPLRGHEEGPLPRLEEAL